MIHRFMIYISLFKSIDWKVLAGSVTFAIAVPYFDLLLRFLVPIASGIFWIFLKPIVLRFRFKMLAIKEENGNSWGSLIKNTFKWKK